MTIQEIIKTLINQGESVKFYQRKDGGFVITKINDTRFQGKKGNAVARTMVGATLSKARKVQLSKIRTAKGKWGHEKKAPLPEQAQRFLKRLQRLHRKKHDTIEGSLSTKNVRYQIEHYGLEQTMRSLAKREIYMLGYAYPENVDYIIQRIRANLDKKPNSSMEGVLNEIEAKKYRFLEDWINPLYDELYKWEQGQQSPEQTAQNILAIIRK